MPATLLSPAALIQIAALPPAIDERLLGPHIQVAQDMHLAPVLTPAFLAHLLEAKATNTMTLPEAYVISGFIMPALAYYTLSEMPIPFWIQYQQAGLLHPRPGGESAPSIAAIELLRQHHLRRAEHYANQLLKHLSDPVHADDYPLFAAAQANKATAATQPFRCGLLLD